MELVRIGLNGDLPIEIEANDHLKMVLEMTGANYQNVGYEEPWIGYVAVDQQRPIGFCGFKSAPKEGRVEIAYHTLPGLEGRGIATSMAMKLIEIAESDSGKPTVFAQTLPEENASTTILKNLGFENVGTVQHPDDGPVWEWEQKPISEHG